MLNDIGAIYQSAACYDEALVHHQKARSIAEEIGNLPQQLIALRRIADIRRGSGRYGEAFEHYHTALAAGQGDRRPVRGRPRSSRASPRSTLSTQRPDAARIVFRQALDIFERLGVPEAESARIRIETLDPAFGLAHLLPCVRRRAAPVPAVRAGTARQASRQVQQPQAAATRG